MFIPNGHGTSLVQYVLTLPHNVNRMAHLPNDLPPGERIIVSRYQGFTDLMVHLGLAAAGTPQLDHPHPEDLRGKHVLTDGIPLSLACHASAVTCVELNLPDEIDTYIAPWRALERFAQAPRTYVVSGSSREQVRQYAGGVTPLAASMAGAVMAAPEDSTQEEIAALLDQLMGDERRAGAESERFLVRSLACERDRRICAEAARMRPPAPSGPGDDSPPLSSPASTVQAA